MADQRNPQLGFSLFASLFSYNNCDPVLLDLDRHWSQTWALTNVLNGGKSRGFTDKDGKFYRTYRKRDAVLCQIASAAQSGANLMLTLTDASYLGFREKDRVMDDNMNEARVIDASMPGKILVAPGFNPTTLTAGTQFPAGQTVRAYEDQSGNFNSVGKKSLYRPSTVQTDYSAVSREAHQQARREKFNTHIGTDGTAFLWSNGEADMIKRAFKNYTKKVWFGNGGTQDSTLEGRYNGVNGIRQQIKNNGVYVSSTTEITQQIFEDLFFSVAGLDGTVEQELTLFMGRNALRKVQGFYSNYIQYAGSQNTFGGNAVQGINIMKVKIAGVMCNLVILGFLNDTLELPSWHADSIYIMDLTPLPGQDSNGQMTMESPLMKIHWGEGAEDVYYNIISGMPSGTGSYSGNGATYKYSSNNVDGTQFELLMDNGISYIADKSALWEQIVV